MSNAQIFNFIKKRIPLDGFSETFHGACFDLGTEMRLLLHSNKRSASKGKGFTSSAKSTAMVATTLATTVTGQFYGQDNDNCNKNGDTAGMMVNVTVFRNELKLYELGSASTAVYDNLVLMMMAVLCIIAMIIFLTAASSKTYSSAIARCLHPDRASLQAHADTISDKLPC